MAENRDSTGNFLRLEPPQFKVAREYIEKTKLAATAPFECHPAKTPETDEAARRTIELACGWARELREAKGCMTPTIDLGSTQACGLLGCFCGGGCFGVESWDLSQFIGVPPDHLTQVVGLDAFEFFLVRNARRGLFGRPMVDKDLAMSHRVVRAHLKKQNAKFAYADKPIEHWERVGGQLFLAYLAERTAALQLCVWIHDAIARYLQAQQFDLVFYKPPNKKSRSKVIIETAAGSLPPIRIDGKEGVPPAVYWAFKTWYTSKAPPSKKLLIVDKSLMYKFINAAMLNGIVRSVSKVPKRGHFAMDDWMRVHLKFK
ncbi:hypothetical protein PLCT2_01790 [Planctomycetaceae bacterium]|nr:hypothetical protein PLCT2_01790 [Planctomycetaceae bacterium]